MTENSESIANLLDKFMAGSTSRAEEQMLAEYFRSADIPKEREAYREMFRYFDEGMPDVAVTGKKALRVRRPLRKIYLWAACVAAGLIVLFLILPRANEISTGRKVLADVKHTVETTADTAARNARQKPAGLTVKPVRNIGRLMQERLVRRPPKRYFAETETAAKQIAVAGDSITGDTLSANDTDRWLAQTVTKDTLQPEMPVRHVPEVEKRAEDVTLTREDILAAIIREQMRRAEVLRTFETMVMEAPLPEYDDIAEE